MDFLKFINKQRQQYTTDQAKELAKLAEEVGVEGGKVNGAQDAFRHIYSAAENTLAYGVVAAKVAGTANEWVNELAKGNPTAEWQMDEYNNAIGRQLGILAQAEGWDKNRLAQEVAYVIQNKQAKVLEPTPDETQGYPGYGNSTPEAKLKFPHDEARQKAVERGAKLFGPHRYSARQVVAGIRAYYKKKQPLHLAGYFFGKK